MSTPAVIGLLKDQRDWSGVYVRHDGYLEGVGAKLLDQLRASGGSVDNTTGRVLGAPQGWQTVFEEPYEKTPASPCPRGVSPRNLRSADPAFIYLFERSGKLHVLSVPHAQSRLHNHSFAGLDRYDRLCSLELNATSDLPALLRAIEPAVLNQTEYLSERWGDGAVERHEIAGLLSRLAASRGATVAALRAECGAALATLLRAKLPAGGPVTVRYGYARAGYATDVGGLTVLTAHDRSPPGVLELYGAEGATASIDQAAILGELEAAAPGLAAAARAILTRRPGWLLELIHWLRQERVPDPVRNQLAPIELRHPDGRKWSVEVMPAASGATAFQLTIVITTSDGEVIERTRKSPTFVAAAAERDQMVAEMRADGFVPA